MNDKEKFYEELMTIENEIVRQQCYEVVLRIDEKFYIVPASSTGKYHPDYATGEGGLYRHTKAAVKIANDLMKLEMFGFTPLNRDYIRAALILHDCCKLGRKFNEKYTRHDHPVLAADFILDILGPGEFSTIVGWCIKSHMGQWNTNEYDSTILPKPELDIEKFVHLCDYLASRKYINIDFNI